MTKWILVSLFVFSSAGASTLSVDSLREIALGADTKTGVICQSGDQREIALVPKITYSIRLVGSGTGEAQLMAEMKIVDKISILENEKVTNSQSSNYAANCASPYIKKIEFGSVFQVSWQIASIEGSAVSGLEWTENGVSRLDEFVQALEATKAAIRGGVRGLELRVTGTGLEEYLKNGIKSGLNAFRARALSDRSMRQITEVETSKTAQ